MIVMPANSTGWFWHCLARETGRIGHLYSPGAERGPWPWFPFAIDNGAFSCWDMKTGAFNDAKWAAMLPKWLRLLHWVSLSEVTCRWAIVPDVPGDRDRTLERWHEYAPLVKGSGLSLAIAVQDGMTAEDVERLTIQPDVIAVGGTDEFKKCTAHVWASRFRRCHMLRCNSPRMLYVLEQMGYESCDGTGWCRGDRKQTQGLEDWARSQASPRYDNLAAYTCRGSRNKDVGDD
jgi:hypothetical protein